MKKKKRIILQDLTYRISFDAFEQIPRDVWGWLIKYIAEFKCEACGSTVKLNSHHIDQNHENNCISNGLCLCRDCHIKLHIALSEKRNIIALKDIIMIKPLDPERES